MPEWLSYGLRFAGVGVSIVFFALFVIAGAISLIRFVDAKWEAREKRERQEALDKEPGLDNTTLVLISAAVATQLTGRFHIRRIRRLMSRNAKSSPWSFEGRAILHGSHVVSKKR